MNDYCRRTGLLKDKDASLAGEDFREGLTVVLSVKMRNIQFEGQTKTKLGNTEARPAVEAVVTQELGKYLEDLKNAATGGLQLGESEMYGRSFDESYFLTSFAPMFFQGRSTSASPSATTCRTYGNTVV